MRVHACVYVCEHSSWDSRLTQNTVVKHFDVTLILEVGLQWGRDYQKWCRIPGWFLNKRVRFSLERNNWVPGNFRLYYNHANSIWCLLTTGCLNLKRLTPSSVDQGVEQPERSSTVGGGGCECSNHLTEWVLLLVIHARTLWSCQSTLRVETRVHVHWTTCQVPECPQQP